MKKIGLIILAIFVFLLIIYGIIRNPVDYFSNGTIILGWVLFFIQTLWVTWENFYLFVKNIWFKLRNPDCSWDFSFDLKNIDLDADEIFLNIENVLNNKKKTFFQISKLSNNRKIYSWGVYTITVTIEYDSSVRFEFNTFEVSYRRTSNVITEDLRPALEEIQRKLKTGEIEYFLNINFQGENPYFGVYLRKIDETKIETFKVKFKINDNKVIVYQDKLSISTNSLMELQEIVNKYLMLSPK